MAIGADWDMRNTITLLLAIATMASAATITFGPAEVDLGQGAGTGGYGTITNQWAAFGIQVSGGELVFDTRDSFDNIGIADTLGVPVSITFDQPVNQLSIDFVLVAFRSGRIELYNDDGDLLSSLTANNPGAVVNNTYASVVANQVKRVTFYGSDPGYMIVSTLQFDTSEVPEPATACVAVGIGVLAILRWRQTRSGSRSQP